MSPAAEEIGALSERLAKYDVVILGTINATAHPGQAELVKKLIKQGTRLITVALRMPYDLAVYPEAPLTFAHIASCRLQWKRWPKRFSGGFLLPVACQ